VPLKLYVGIYMLYAVNLHKAEHSSTATDE
jgi:hypothetical protein